MRYLPSMLRSRGSLLLLCPAAALRAASFSEAASPASSSGDAAYRQSVISTATATKYPVWNESLGAPLVRVIQYDHLGLGCSDIPASVSFYENIGFSVVGANSKSSVIRLRNSEGLELHLFKTGPPPDGKNVLMDFPTQKHPGHTHASWKVASVPGVKHLLAELQVPLSGTRSTLAVFVRDPDRTTLEFERNDGKDDFDDPTLFRKQDIGFGKTLDHVGTRISAPYDEHLNFYARTLGFTLLVRHYTPNPEPLKNFAPLITKSVDGCEINFIPNCNTSIPPSTNALVAKDGSLLPGILFTAVTIRESWSVAYARLKAANVDVIVDTELISGKKKSWGDFPCQALRAVESGPTLLMRDLNGSVWRLVPSSSSL